MSSEHLLLGIDTSAAGSVALASLDSRSSLQLLGERQLEPMRFSHELLPEIAKMLQASGKKLRELTGLIVVNGPGGFTGLRIGLSAAKGLAEALSLPVVAVSSLIALVAGQSDDTAAVLRAGRGEVYLGRFYDAGWIETIETEAAAKNAVRGGKVLTQEPRLVDVFSPVCSITLVTERASAQRAIEAVKSRVIAGESDDTAALDANYVRRPYTSAAANVDATFG